MSIVNMIDTDKFENFMENKDMEDAYYKSLQKDFTEIKLANNFKYLYTESYDKDGKTTVYGVDTLNINVDGDPYEIGEAVNADIALESVEKLVSDSERILNFLDFEVVKNYEMFLATGQQYTKESNEMVSIFEEFNISTQKLYDSTNVMTKSIDDITSAANATTEDVMNIVGDVEHINSNSETLYEEINTTKQRANELIELVNHLKIQFRNNLKWDKFHIPTNLIDKSLRIF